MNNNDNSNRFFDPKANAGEEIQNERSLRPQSFAEIIGREKEKRLLRIMIEKFGFRK